MNKLYVLPLFLGAVSLTSCSGFAISSSDAQQRMNQVINLATENGKYIGGNFLTRQSTFSNITYDLDAAIVEEHRVEDDYYFDIKNNYFRFNETITDVVTQYEDQEEKKTVDIDYYLYVLSNQVVNVVITTVNGVQSDKTISRTPVSDISMRQFVNTIDMYYSSYIDIYEETVKVVSETVEKGDDYISSVGGELNSFGPNSLTLYATELLANKNLYVAYKFNQLSQVEVFDRNTHDLYTETFNYGPIYLNYVQ